MAIFGTLGHEITHKGISAQAPSPRQGWVNCGGTDRFPSVVDDDTRSWALSPRGGGTPPRTISIIPPFSEREPRSAASERSPAKKLPRTLCRTPETVPEWDSGNTSVDIPSRGWPYLLTYRSGGGTDTVPDFSAPPRCVLIYSGNRWGGCSRLSARWLFSGNFVRTSSRATIHTAGTEHARYGLIVPIST